MTLSSIHSPYYNVQTGYFEEPLEGDTSRRDHHETAAHRIEVGGTAMVFYICELTNGIAHCTQTACRRNSFCPQRNTFYGTRARGAVPGNGSPKRFFHFGMCLVFVYVWVYWCFIVNLCQGNERTPTLRNNASTILWFVIVKSIWQPIA
jgi:hypothetical protein